MTSISRLPPHGSTPTISSLLQEFTKNSSPKADRSTAPSKKSLFGPGRVLKSPIMKTESQSQAPCCRALPQNCSTQLLRFSCFLLSRCSPAKQRDCPVSFTTVRTPAMPFSALWMIKPSQPLTTMDGVALRCSRPGLAKTKMAAVPCWKVLQAHHSHERESRVLATVTNSYGAIRWSSVRKTCASLCSFPLLHLKQFSWRATTTMSWRVAFLRRQRKKRKFDILEDNEFRI